MPDAPAAPPVIAKRPSGNLSKRKPKLAIRDVRRAPTAKHALKPG